MTISSKSYDRRTLLRFSACTAAVATLPASAIAQFSGMNKIDIAKKVGDVVLDEVTKGQGFTTLLARFADEILQLTPETATSLGLDKKSNARLKTMLSDGSPSGEAKWTAQVQSMLARLDKINRSDLSATNKIRYDTVRYAAQQGADGTKFFYGGAAGGFFGGATPYPVTQQDGAITGIPEFLNALHQIDSKADAAAYLDRVSAMARLLDQESEQIARDAARGVTPPSFIARTALGQLTEFGKTPAAQQTLVTSISERTAKLGIKGDWAERTTKLVEGSIYPALARQIAALTKASATAPDIAGVHRLPDGEAYYRWALKLGTTTDLSPQEIHDVGLEQNKAIQARMDTILKAQGMNKGTVGERLLALTKDPSMLYPDTDQGRADLIAYCNDRVSAMRKLMPQLSNLGLKSDLFIKRVAPDIQDGAPLGYMNFASLDGTRPAIYYINLKSTTLWPKYQLATLTAHEGVPGHAWQGAYLAERSKDVPLIASLTGFNAFVEGWALYAEQLCDEAGLYANDAFSQLGYLQAQQFRACRLVVDTGLHALKWTRQQAIQFLVENTGRGLNSMTSEVDRYSVSPGQACGYKVGHNEINRLRDKAKASMGGKFDLATFNDTIVKTGGVPLTVLANVIDTYIG
jgi:uncharacterized protein (DUF885 family)